MARNRTSHWILLAATLGTLACSEPPGDAGAVIALSQPQSEASGPAAGGTGAASANTPNEPARSPRELAAALGDLLAEREGTYGLYVEHVRSGESIVLNATRPFPAASVYKLALAHEVLRLADAGQLKLDEPVTIEAADAVEPEPDGGLGEGESVPIREALHAMMSVSSNTASHALLRRIGRARFEASLHELGMRDTRIPRRDEAFWPWEWLLDARMVMTTPADMGRLLRLVARGETLSDQSRGLLLELLALPERTDPLVGSLPAEASVRSKVGELEDATNIAALLTTSSGPVVLVVLDEQADVGEAREVITAAGNAIYAHYSP